VSTSAWFDASDLSTITESAGSVSQWNDKSGNSNNATESDPAKQPTIKNRSINGLNVLDFDGTTDRMLFNNIACFGKSLFAVIESDVSENTIIVGGNALNNQFKYRAGGSLSYASADRIYTIDPDSQPDKIPTNTPGFGSLVLNNTTGRAGANGIYKDGTGVLQAFANGDQFGQVGARGPLAAGEDFFNGKIGEIIIYDGVDQDTVDKIDGYLAWKWGLQGSLPTNHPYKQRKPLNG
jgi:hypothetical protein